MMQFCDYESRLIMISLNEKGSHKAICDLKVKIIEL